MKKQKTHTLIISDIHLGSRVCRIDAVLNLLKNISCKKLILLGDIFDDLDFEDLNDQHWKFLALIRKKSEEKKTKVIWVEGNHDRGLTKVMTNLVGIKAYKRYSWKYEGKKYLAIHGHQFDRFLINNKIISEVAVRFYILLQLLGGKKQTFSRFVKRESKGWLRNSKKVKKGAIFYARLRKVDFIFCGHTHQATESKRKDVRYFNSGCWTDIPSTYVTIDGDDVKINKHS